MSWATDYAKRLGIFSPLNPDLTLVLGSSSLTLYEMTKVFSHFGRLGARIHLKSGVARLEGKEGRFIAAHLADGRRIEADLALVAIGVVPTK